MRSTLRAQIALASGLIALIVVALAGAVIALRMDHRDRSMVDSQLSARAERVVADLDKLTSDGNAGRRQPNDGYGDLLDGTESLVRLFDGTTILAQRGAVPERPLAPPASDGFTTVAVDGTPWRSYVVDANAGPRLQVLQSLEPVDERRAANTRLVVLVTLLAACVSAAAGWYVGSRVLRPLDWLAVGATAIAHDPDPHHRLPAVTQPAEIAALSSTLNGMLDRLGASTETTRRFAADVGHELRGPLTVSGAYLETLLGSADLTDEAREPLSAVHDQHQRMVSTLNALQVLARADAGAVPPPAEVEPGVMAEELVRLARKRHPTVTFSLEDFSAGAAVAGWPDGLRIAIDNLLDNAALHGRSDGNVEVHVTAGDGRVAITVEDDGPGIPAAQRQRLRARFTRGTQTTGHGTGLGLALVDQQAALHGGNLTLRTSRSGGLCAELTIPEAR